METIEGKRPYINHGTVAFRRVEPFGYLAAAGRRLSILGPRDPLPAIAYPRKSGDVGYDIPVLVTRERQTWVDRLVSRWIKHPAYVVWPLQMRSFHTGVALQMNGMGDDKWCSLEARSSTRIRGLEQSGGRVIDSHFRGALFAVVRCFRWYPVIVREGDRLMQLVFFPVVGVHLEEVEEFDGQTERGTAGFGSTGR